MDVGSLDIYVLECIAVMIVSMPLMMIVMIVLVVIMVMMVMVVMMIMIVVVVVVMVLGRIFIMRMNCTVPFALGFWHQIFTQL